MSATQSVPRLVCSLTAALLLTSWTYSVFSAPAPADPYDTRLMDLAPVPATLGGERHSGPFALGDALSLNAVLQPLDPAAVKTVRLDATHKIIEIAPGVHFSARTFG